MFTLSESRKQQTVTMTVLVGFYHSVWYLGSAASLPLGIDILLLPLLSRIALDHGSGLEPDRPRVKALSRRLAVL
jgi:hypothetical protein